MHTRLSHAILVVLALSSSVMAQTFSLDPNPETYGTASEVAIAVSQFAFSPGTSLMTTDWNQGRWLTNGGSLSAGIQLPAGASITRLELQACDTNATAQGRLSIVETSNSTGYGVILAIFGTGTTATPGCTLFDLTLSSPHTVNNAINSYFLQWDNQGSTDGSVKIQAARVYYKLQISPDPGTATFADVPVGHPFHRFVEALYASGITGGCGGGNFCPDAPVTRGQMAVFLAGALGLHWAP
jgi:hypothetical protein